MNWIREGLIFAADGRYDWMVSHTQFPVVDPIGEERLRIYFGTRDRHNRTQPTFIEVDASNPRKVLYVHDRPVLGLGQLGCFDDSGVMPGWVVNHEGLKYLYYIGINVGATVPYRNSIGLAISSDGGRGFERAYAGPVMERFASEPHLCASPCVLVENRTWKMWYASGLKWELVDGRPEPFYNLRYTESPNGVDWQRPGRVALDLRPPEEGGIGRACVLPGRDAYRMWLSSRGAGDYRTSKAHTYRIGYAESRDGVEWVRNDVKGGMDVAQQGWDAEMVAYPYVYRRNGALHMVYNGNGFGRSGLGYAVESPA